MACWQSWELGYCSNVHPAADLAQVFDVVRRQISGVRAQRSRKLMGAGLWVGSAAIVELLAASDGIEAFQRLLADNGIRLFTLNGFPFGNFHSERVKAQVYQPDWADPDRFDYTLDLARLLAHCLPSEVSEGTLSTVPLGFGPGWDSIKQAQALAALCRMAAALAGLREQTGRCIRVCLEMEPGCVLESTPQMIRFFSEELPANAADLGVPEAWLIAHLGVCYDVCHQAVMFEDPADSLAELHGAGIPIGKIQISSALELPQPLACDPGQLLAAYAEPRYLHQVRTLDEGSGVTGVMDLPEALAGNGFPRQHAWRIHFHVPIQATSLASGRLATTQGAIGGVLDFLRKHPDLHPHLEVETYTWQVLPEDLRPPDEAGLRRGLAGELDWLEAEMNQRGLLETPGP